MNLGYPTCLACHKTLDTIGAAWMGVNGYFGVMLDAKGTRLYPCTSLLPGFPCGFLLEYAAFCSKP